MHNGSWLVIDEFNRADIDKAFGELFTAIEYRKLKVPTMKQRAYEEIPIPSDYRIIGTLNSFDKHYLFKLSDALKRRFAFVEIQPPHRDQVEKEKYCALKRCKDQLAGVVHDSKLNSITLDATSKQIVRQGQLPPIVKTIDSAYNILDYVRMSKNLGTASLIQIFAYIFTDEQNSDADFDHSLDAALKVGLVPQLENVQKWAVEAIREFCCGDIVAFLRNKNREEFSFNKYIQEFTKLLQYEKKDEITRRTENYRKGNIQEEGWLSYNPWPPERYRPDLPLFRRALDDLIRELELV